MGRIQVGVRCRPPFEHELDWTERSAPRFESALELESRFVHIVPHHSRHFSQRSFGFDYVWPDSTTQAQVYDDAIAPLVSHVLHGQSATVLAYGQTGTGKSYTMGFLEATTATELGIIPRVFEHLFHELENAPRRVQMSFAQIYMENINDLLVAPPSGLVDLPVRQRTEDGVFYVDGLESFDVASLDDARCLVQMAMTNRTLAATSRNPTSSRSHTILTISIASAKLVLVDLAGSERTLNGFTAGMDIARTRLNEAKFINSSLSALGNVISSLAASSSAKASYRDSKLTKLLKGCFGTHGRTLVLATIDGAGCNLAETLSTLKFASRCRQVPLVPKVKSKEQAALAVKPVRTIATQTVDSGDDVDQLREAFQKKEIELHMLYQEQLYKLRRALEQMSLKQASFCAVGQWNDRPDHDDDELSVSTEDDDDSFNQVQF
ncbi:hypothetical protein ACHHYP_15672 [Achlya hypogyna]|uniref:Kinesin-like protein n=1 Tax=Achlya hypogyna TaxID=1202772 RepID=A0A1V9YAA3_ACHHY|nr:hypothetical protein ACHHYP_15672 [Achlya hypogyna]